MSYLMDRLLADQQRLRGESMPPQCPPCHHRCEQGRQCPAREACATEGGTHADPVPSGTTHRKRWGGPAGLLIVALSAVVSCYLIGTTLAALGVPLY